MEKQDKTTKFTDTALKAFNVVKAEFKFKNSSIALLELIKTTVNEAIKLAIEKGEWLAEFPNKNIDVKNKRVVIWVKNSIGYIEHSYSEIVLYSEFWQALGKALGWNTLIPEYMTNEQIGKIIEPNEWIQYALDYYLYSLTGGDTEKFWKELIQ